MLWLIGKLTSALAAALALFASLSPAAAEAADKIELPIIYREEPTPAREAAGMTATFELALTREPDGSLKLTESVRYGGQGGPMRMTVSRPDEAAPDAVRAVIARHKMTEWHNMKPGIPDDGGPALYCSFTSGGRTIRVTRDDAPSAHQAAFSEIKRALLDNRGEITAMMHPDPVFPRSGEPGEE